MATSRSRASTSLTVSPSMQDFAAGRVLEAGNHAHGGGLAAARGAEEHHEFLVADVEVDGIDADDGAPGLADLLAG